MQAMLIGGLAFFGRELKTNFQRTGTYHILVVSGINVGILAFAFFWLLRRFPMGEETATVLTILFSWGYAFLADLGPPIVRATITLTFTCSRACSSAIAMASMRWESRRLASWSSRRGRSSKRVFS